MIPAIDPATGNLPPGVHDATLDEVIERYGATERRRALLVELRDAVNALQAAGCRCLYLNGSFVGGKAEPGDYDVCWDNEGVDLFELMRAAEELLEYRPERRGPRQKARYGGDFFALPPEGRPGREMLAVFQQHGGAGRRGGHPHPVRNRVMIINEREYRGAQATATSLAASLAEVYARPPQQPGGFDPVVRGGLVSQLIEREAELADYEAHS